MAEIKIQNLEITGFDLLLDPESFLNELSDNETSNVVAGLAMARGNSGTSYNCGGAAKLAMAGNASACSIHC
jgi:hypothetical protein